MASPDSPFARPASDAAPWRNIALTLSRFPLLRGRLYGEHPGHGKRPLVLHFHGGHFLGGLRESGHGVARLLAEAGAVVVSVDYPVGIDGAFPRAVEAGYAALEWINRPSNRDALSRRSAKLWVAGEEAGGNLAAAVAMMARDRQTPRLHGQILISPMLDPWLATASMREVDAGTAGCPWAAGWHQYLPDPSDAHHPYAVPGAAQRLNGLPRTLVLTARDDPMRDDAFNYARRLREAGVPVEGHILPGPTGWPQALGDQDCIETSWAAEVRRHLRHCFESTDAGHAESATRGALSF